MHDIKGIFENDIIKVYNQLYNEFQGDFDKMMQRLFEMEKENENESINNYYHEDFLNEELHKKYLVYSLCKNRILKEKLKKTMSIYKR